VLDVTEKKFAEQKLMESEEKYRSIFLQANDGIFLMDENLKISDVNSTTVDIFGYDNVEEIIGKTPWDLTPLKQPDGMLSKEKGMDYVKSTLEGKPQKFYWTHIKKDKSLIDCDISLNQIIIEGKPYIQAFIRDITKKKIAERKLIESEGKFRTITEDSHLAISILQDDLVVYTNQKMADMFGYDIKEMLTWTPKEYAKTVAEDSLEFIMEQARKKQIGDPDVKLQYPIHCVKRSGEKFWVDNISTTIWYNGRPADLITIIDITEKRKAEELIIEENRKLLEIDKMRNNILTRFSHELKTPLTSMFGATQLLQYRLKGKLSEKDSQSLDYLNEGFMRLKELMINIVESIKLDEKQFTINLQTTDMVKIIRESIKELMYLKDIRNQKIELNLPDVYCLEVDKISIGQAITNLLSNAIKNTPPNGIISIKLTENEKYCDIIIKDTGVGITEKEREKLFEKFGKIERYGMNLDVDIEGSGLGLYISKEIVELHNGKILVESEGRNKGSTFTIRIFH
jgi:PAS domain S-box-containing protein